ncbi:MAG: helix-turn-helix transcriptional regulator [Bacteroidota bacterium]
MNGNSPSRFDLQKNKGNFTRNTETNKNSTSKTTKPYLPLIYTGKEQLIIEAEKIILENIDNNRFTVSQMAEMLWVSERKLQRHMKKLTGMCPWQFVRKVRMTVANKLVERKKYSSIKRIAKAVGYRDLRSFRKHYMNQYGVWLEV